MQYCQPFSNKENHECYGLAQYLSIVHLIKVSLSSDGTRVREMGEMASAH